MQKAKEEQEKKLWEEKLERQNREQKMAEEKKVERQQREVKLAEEKRAKFENIEAEKRARQEKAEAEVKRKQENAQKKEAEQERLRLENLEKQNQSELLRGAEISADNGQLHLTQAEKDRVRKRLLIQSQFTVFKKYYPDLIEKKQIKYPIDDKLIFQMPELHGNSVL